MATDGSRPDDQRDIWISNKSVKANYVLPRAPYDKVTFNGTEQSAEAFSKANIDSLN